MTIAEPSSAPSVPKLSGSSVGGEGEAFSRSPSGWLSQSQSHGFQTFGQYSEFLRTAVADEESLQVGESLQSLAGQVESLLSMLQKQGPAAPALSQALINLLGDLRAHRALLLGLSADWHRFFEFDAHFAALNHLRILVTQWAMDAAPPKHQMPPFAEFDLVAWRVLGAGSLLLDVYDQSRLTSVAAHSARKPPSLWMRWMAWWQRRRMRVALIRKNGRRGRRATD